MQGLAWAELEAVLNECFISAAALSAQYLFASICGICKERMTDMLHMCTYLMRATCLKYALHERCIAKAFDNAIVGNCILSDATVGRKDFHAQSVLGVTGYVSLDRSLVVNEVSPYQGVVTTVG